MKQSISPAERLQLIGLFALADSYNRKDEDLLNAAYELLHVRDGDGEAADHIHGALFNDEGRDELLDVLGVVVTEEE